MLRVQLWCIVQKFMVISSKKLWTTIRMDLQCSVTCIESVLKRVARSVKDVGAGLKSTSYLPCLAVTCLETFHQNFWVGLLLHWLPQITIRVRIFLKLVDRLTQWCCY